MDDKINLLKNWIEESKNIVFFGGAGVSTESGIPDFRSKDGLYNQKFDYPPEIILSHTFFYNHTDLFFKFYKEKMDLRKFKPNIAHKYLNKLEKNGKLSGIITQNIDGLHQKAGSKNVYELHGSIYRNYCLKCGEFYDADYIFESNNTPVCHCGGIIKPDVVLYEEPLDENVINRTIDLIKNCDLLIIAGTSLKVYPACDFINFYTGNRKVLINKEINGNINANLVINSSLGDVIKKL